MGFLGGIGKVFSGAFNALKSFASSGLGQMLIKMAGTALGGPLGGVLAQAATSLLSGKFNLKNLVKAGLGAFGGMVGNFGLTDLVKNLPAALKNPAGLLKGVSNLFKGGGLGNIVGNLFRGTPLGNTISSILDKAKNFLGTATNIGNGAKGVVDSINNLLGTFGVKAPFLDRVSQGIGSVLNTVNNISNIVNQVGGLFSGGDGMQMLRA
ncbi:MAG: hypothetical protein JNN15_01195 [Blastocatellia bacterium]|nr:hypothetical protein [Blastocatellia bacterium]